MTTIYQVSERAKVSLATVSRVMNNSQNVSDKTREKVLLAMQELGYRPNTIAQSLASNRGNCVGLLVPQLDGVYFGNLMAGVERKLHAAGKHIIVTTGNNDEKQEKSGIEFLNSRNCDAIILYAEAVSDEYLLSLSKEKTPIYLVNRIIEALAEQCVSLDNELGGYLATKLLLEQGHRRIACIAGHQHKIDALSRLNGYKRALAEEKIDFTDDLIFAGDFAETTGKEGLAYLLQHNDNISAIVCANDEVASGVICYAREIGLSLPQDLSIVGFDDVVFARYLHPKLTTVVNPIKQMGEMAAKLVMRDIYQEKDINIEHTFKPKLIVRESTRIYLE